MLAELREACSVAEMPSKEVIEFAVQGSAPEPYQVLFFRSGPYLRAHCDCDAGRNWMHCKHRLRILEGSADEIVSGNTHEIATVQSWLVGTDLEQQLTAISQLEQQAAALKKQISTAKKTLGKIMGKD